jgi:hypothetical protein
VSGLGGSVVDQYLVTAPALSSSQVLLNGQPLTVPPSGALATTSARHHQSAPFVSLPPQSYAFLQITDASAAPCH